jgi:hypothetical protein
MLSSMNSIKFPEDATARAYATAYAFNLKVSRHKSHSPRSTDQDASRRFVTRMKSFFISDSFCRFHQRRDATDNRLSAPQV